MGIYFVQMNGQSLFQRECNNEKPEIHSQILKIFYFRTTGPIFQPNMTNSILEERGFKLVQVEQPRPFPRGDN